MPSIIFPRKRPWNAHRSCSIPSFFCSRTSVSKSITQRHLRARLRRWAIPVVVRMGDGRRGVQRQHDRGSAIVRDERFPEHLRLLRRVLRYREPGWAQSEWAHHPPEIKSAIRQARFRPRRKHCFANCQILVMFGGLEDATYHEGVISTGIAGRSRVLGPDSRLAETVSRAESI